MTFRALLGRLGIAEVARRAGVTEGTVRRWARDGLSSSGRSRVREVAKRSEAARQAAETRRAVAEEKARQAADRAARRKRKTATERARRTRDARDQFRELIADQTDTPKASAPREGPRPRRTRDYLKPGTAKIESFRYQGETTTHTVGRPLAATADSALTQMVVNTWKQSSDRSPFVRVVFLMFRYLPPGPDVHYRGVIIPRDGKWVPWWTSTKVQATEGAIVDNVFTVLDDARNKTIGNNIIWLEQVQVSSFEWKEDAELPSAAQLLNRRLRHD